MPVRAWQTLAQKPGEPMDPFTEALVYAAELHAGQVRKGTDTPYVAHLLGVTALVLENGGDTDQAIAALLHDAAEDQGGRDTLHEIEKRFGEKVAKLVEALSDTLDDPKPAWRPRKESYLRRLAIAEQDELLISAADKVHNARAILRDLGQSGPSIWDRFKGKRSGTLWYYSELVQIFRKNFPGYLADELDQLVQKMQRFHKNRTEDGQDEY